MSRTMTPPLNTYTQSSLNYLKSMHLSLDANDTPSDSPDIFVRKSSMDKRWYFNRGFASESVENGALAQRNVISEKKQEVSKEYSSASSRYGLFGEDDASDEDVEVFQSFAPENGAEESQHFPEKREQPVESEVSTAEQIAQLEQLWRGMRVSQECNAKPTRSLSTLPPSITSFLKKSTDTSRTLEQNLASTEKKYATAYSARSTHTSIAAELERHKQKKLQQYKMLLQQEEERQRQIRDAEEAAERERQRREEMRRKKLQEEREAEERRQREDEERRERAEKEAAERRKREQEAAAEARRKKEELAKKEAEKAQQAQQQVSVPAPSSSSLPTISTTTSTSIAAPKSTDMRNPLVRTNKYITYLQQVRASFASVDTKKNLEFKSRKESLNLTLGQISNEKEVIAQKLQEVLAKLENSRAVSPQLFNFCLDSVASKLVAKAEVEIARDDSAEGRAAMPYGLFVVRLMKMVPEFADLMVGALYNHCPYVIPVFPEKSDYPQMSEDEFKVKVLKYKILQKRVESTKLYMERMTGIVRLYAAIVSCSEPGNPHGIEYGWMWLASVVNTKRVHAITCTLLISFLEIAGYSLWERYKMQFIKVMQVMNQHMLTQQFPDDHPHAPPTQLKLYCRYVQEKGQPKKPTGIIDENAVAAGGWPSGGGGGGGSGGWGASGGGGSAWGAGGGGGGWPSGGGGGGFGASNPFG